MAGTVARYHLDSTAEHLIAPLDKAGWKVDYFYSLYDGNLATNSRTNQLVPVSSFFEAVGPDKTGGAMANPKFLSMCCRIAGLNFNFTWN